MKIDARLKDQRFKNIYGLNPVYVWKEKDKTYSVGINGTSHHHVKLTKEQAELTVTCLIFAKN